eukprot:6027782-Lingulodinium_polyedra.AAC.1
MARWPTRLAAPAESAGWRRGAATMQRRMPTPRRDAERLRGWRLRGVGHLSPGANARRPVDPSGTECD